MRIPVALLSVAGSLIAAQAPPVEHFYFSKGKHDHKTNWGYTGPTGPEFWAGLDPSFAAAAAGKLQSPIDLDSKVKPSAKLPALKFDYREEQITAINSGHTIEHKDSPGSFLRVGGETYSLEQFHAHAPSEHTLDGKSFPMEIHFVHKSKTGAVAVVGVLVQADKSSKLDSPLLNDLPKTEGEGVATAAMRAPADFLPARREYFSYSGSFTTPPCTEGVQWFVLKQPLGLSPRIIARFAAVLNGNNRPVQKLNGRMVELSP